jgi:SAM-dependent methyltransferase
VAGGFQWDETLYRGSAEFYATGRVPYPPELADALAAELGLDGSGRLLDCGCGPGPLTLLLAPLFEQAVGIDADAGMVGQARLAARRAGVGNATFRRLRAEELPAGLGEFRLVTFAQSFHWVDQELVARAVRQMVTGDGACALVFANTHEGLPGDDELPRPRPPRSLISALIDSYLGPARRAGKGVRPDILPHDSEAMGAAGFGPPRRLEVGGGVRLRSEDEVVASVFSLSFAAPHLFGDRRDEFEQDLRALLAEASRDGQFAERMREIAVEVWRPAAG